MRIFRIVLATALLSITTSAVVLTASVAHAAPFSYSSVNVGYRNACAISNEGTLLCWGENRDHQISATRNDQYFDSPAIVPMPERITSVDTSYGYTLCALGESGRAYCWGNGGHLGSYFTTTSSTPVRVEFPNDMRVTNLQNGAGNACALDSGRALWCWGDPLSLGDGGVDSVRVPVKLTMPDNSPIAQYDMGLSDTCVVTDQGHMYCWGPVITTRSWWSSTGYSPVQVNAPAGTSWVSTQTEGARVCGITATGSAYCFGDNYNGNFGNGTYDDSSTITRMVVPNNELVQSIHLGSYATCITTTVNNIWCVGEGGQGQLGTGTTLSGKTWRSPLLPSGVVLTGLSMSHIGTCGINVDGKLWCWSYVANYSVTNGYVYNNLFPVARVEVGTPEVTTPTASNVTTRSALLTASATPFGFATSGTIEYSRDETFATSTVVTIAGRTVDGAQGLLGLTAVISGLSPRTTYYARAHAHNVAGSAVSGVVSFTTLGSEPSVLSLDTLTVTGNEATVRTDIDPGLLFTEARVQYSDTMSFTDETPSATLGSLSGDQVGQLSAALVALEPQRTYYLRVIATNELGTVYSEPISFSTVGDTPTITQFSGDANNSSIATNVSITTGDTRGTVTFQLSRSNTFASIIHTDTRHFSSSGPQSFSFYASSLARATTYYVRAIVSNALGTDTSAILALRTKGSAPIVGQLNVNPVVRGGAFTFSLDTTGISTLAVINISANSDFTNYTSHFAYSGSHDGNHSVLLNVDNLNPNVKYFARVSATNELGHTESNIVTFHAVRPIGVVINDDQVSTNDPHVILNMRYPGDTVALRVSNNEDFSGARIFTPALSLSWDLVVADQPVSLRTVYVQFINSRGNVALYTDEISLESDISTPDEEAPVITSLRAVSAPSAPSVSAAALTTKKNTRTFVVAISDKASGVTRIQTKVGTRIATQKVQAVRRGEYAIEFGRNVKAFAIRVIDREGNASKWKKITVR